MFSLAVEALLIHVSTGSNILSWHQKHDWRATLPYIGCVSLQQPTRSHFIAAGTCCAAIAHPQILCSHCSQGSILHMLMPAFEVNSQMDLLLCRLWTLLQMYSPWHHSTRSRWIVGPVPGSPPPSRGGPQSPAGGRMRTRRRPASPPDSALHLPQPTDRLTGAPATMQGRAWTPHCP